MINVAINGLGRIGKSILKILFNEKNINIVFVNDLNPSIQNLCYLVNYDSIYGNLNDPLIPVGNSLIKYKNQTLKYSNKKNIKNLNLKNVDVLIDSTGKSLNNSDITFLKKKN